MSEEQNNLQVARSIGELTGVITEMSKAVTAQLGDIRADIRRLESSQVERVDRLERNINQRVDGLEVAVNKHIDLLGRRVDNLEAEDKRLIDKTARLSAMGGGAGGMLAAGLIELLKHIR